jgi:predicted ATPase
MAYPGAEILSFDQQPIAPVSYDSLEHVNLMRDFLNDPDAFLRHL